MSKIIKSETKQSSSEKKYGRHPVLYALSVIILVVIVVTFLGSPIAGDLGGGSSIVFGKFANHKIEFYPGNYLSNQRDILAQNIDNSSENIQFQAYQVWRGAFERTVIHTAILWFAEQSGIHVSNDKINKTIIDYGPYTINGDFNAERYNQASTAEKAEVRKSVRENLIKENYINDFFVSNKTSSSEADFIISMTEKERSIDIAYMSFDNYPDSEVISFAETNIEIFKSINLSKITILSSRRDADRVLKIVRENPESFADTARNVSQDSYAETGGEAGKVFSYELNMEVKNSSDIDKILSLDSGNISEVIETAAGWTIYRSNSPTDQPDLTSPDFIRTVRRYLFNYETGKIEDYFISLSENLNQNIDNFYDLGADGFKFYRTETFPVNFGESAIFKPVIIENAPSDLSNLNYNEDFLVKAFSIEYGEISEPVILRDSIILISLNMEIENTEYNQMLKAYYPYLKQQMNEQSLSLHLLTSDKLVDNFYETFIKYFMVN